MRSLHVLRAGLRTCIFLTVLVASGCAEDLELDFEELESQPTDGPTVEFDPAAQILPLPNQLLISPATGRVELPAPCGETAAEQALREQTLNQLDGFGAYRPLLQITTTHPVEPSTLPGRLRIWRLATSGEAVAPAAAQPVSWTALTDTVARPGPSCDTSQTVHRLVVIPTEPLVGNSRYGVVLSEGVRTTDGEALLPSATWALVRQATNPVTVQNGEVVFHRTPFDALVEEDRTALLGLHQLWQASTEVLQFAEGAAGVAREETLLAWSFPTQTLLPPLDPGVDGSPAASLQPALQGLASLATGGAEAYLQGALGLTPSQCADIGCSAVGDVLGGTLITTGFQREQAGPLGEAVPGPWGDPLRPSSTGQVSINVLVAVPAGPAPASGWPVVVFGHDLSRRKEDLLALAPALAQAGVAVAGIDWVGHGARAVQISNGAGCEGVGLDPTERPQCFAPIFSPQLAVTRDNLRQSALDALALVMALGQCDGAGCGGLSIDPARRGYLGHGLGSFIGTLVVASSSDVEAAVLNAGGAGWIDLLERTQSVSLRCAWVDALIEAGVLTGQVSDLAATPPTGACLTDAWQQQAAWRAFANLARWVLDPAEPIHFAPRLRGRPVLIQQVVEDALIPNFSTVQLAQAADVSPAQAGDAQLAASASPLPSRGTGPGAQVTWLRYATAPAQGAFAGNIYGHGSLLALPEDCAGSTECIARMLATAQIQTDAVTFLGSNL